MENSSYHIIAISSDNPYFPMASIHDHTPFKRYLPEHRLIMAQYLGRCLAKSEIVHHINGNRADNRIENLELLQSRKEHKKRHPNTIIKHQGVRYKDLPLIAVSMDLTSKEALQQDAKRLGLLLTTYCRMILIQSLPKPTS